MSRTRALFLAAAACATAAPAYPDDDGGKLKAALRGYSEVPAVSSTGMGRFTARVAGDGSAVEYELTFAGLEGQVLFSHIHLGQKDVNGGVAAFLCGGGGKPDCPQEGTVTGTVTAADVEGPVAQGIAAGELRELLRAIDAGVTYVNVHSTKHPGGEIRGQVKGGTD